MNPNLCRAHTQNEHVSRKLVHIVDGSYVVASMDVARVTVKFGLSIDNISREHFAQSPKIAFGTSAIHASSSQEKAISSPSHETSPLQPPASQQNISNAALKYITDFIVIYGIAVGRPSLYCVQSYGYGFGDDRLEPVQHFFRRNILGSRHLCSLLQPPPTLLNQSQVRLARGSNLVAPTI